MRSVVGVIADGVAVAQLLAKLGANFPTDRAPAQVRRRKRQFYRFLQSGGA